MPNDKPQAKKTVLDKTLLGKRMRKARLRAGLNLDEVSASLGVTPELLSKVEAGQQDISLPQLEALALICNINVTDFWAEELPQDEQPEYPTLQIIILRQRIVGALLRHARIEAGQSEEDIANLLNISPNQVTDYELGQTEIPLRQLDVLKDNFNVSLNYFLDNGIAISNPKLSGQLTMLDQHVEFAKLPEDVREFLANPANLLYLNIAMKLSELSVDTLRGLAEGLLEVTY
jgi:transcriptional regulator with XRE-family HTH domain